MIPPAVAIYLSDWQVALLFLTAVFLVGAVLLGVIDKIADAIEEWFDQRNVRDHLRWWNFHRDDIEDEEPPPFEPDVARLWLHPEIGTCADGFHLTFVENPDGELVCSDCGSLDVIPQTHPCSCGRGPVVVLLGFEACCARCAVEAVPELLASMERHPSSRASQLRAGGTVTGPADLTRAVSS